MDIEGEGLRPQDSQPWDNATPLFVIGEVRGVGVHRRNNADRGLRDSGRILPNDLRSGGVTVFGSGSAAIAIASADASTRSSKQRATGGHPRARSLFCGLGTIE
jgi:hypothetical protein